MDIKNLHGRVMGSGGNVQKLVKIKFYVSGKLEEGEHELTVPENSTPSQIHRFIRAAIVSPFTYWYEENPADSVEERSDGA